MSIWVVIGIVIAAVVYLSGYYHWLTEKHGISPFRWGAMASMVIASFFVWFFFFDLENPNFLLLIPAAVLMLITLLSNISYASNAGRGCMITLWQAVLSIMIAFLIIVMWGERGRKKSENKKDEK